MRSNGFTLTAIIPAKPAEIYKAWLGTRGHSAMTGSPAKMEGKPGGRFTAWDGYISGSVIDLTPDKRIILSWRTTEFPEDAPDSHVEILLKEDKGGTKITLAHTGMPEDQMDDYKQGWEDFYFRPMREFFENRLS